MKMGKDVSSLARIAHEVDHATSGDLSEALPPLVLNGLCPSSWLRACLVSRSTLLAGPSGCGDDPQPPVRFVDARRKALSAHARE